MKLEIEAKKLHAALKVLLAAAPGKTTIPILAHCQIDPENLTAEMTDLELAIRLPLEATSKGKGGSFCVPARKLAEVAGTLQGALTLEPLENHWLRVTANGTKLKMVGLAADNFPQLAAAPAGDGLLLPAGKFLEALRRVRFAISKEESRYTLNGALLEIKDGKVRVVATDGHRLALAEFPGGEGGEVRCIVPRNALAALDSIPSNDAGNISFSEVDSSVFFRVGNGKEGKDHSMTLLCARKLEGQFPNYLAVLPGEAAPQVVIARDALMDAFKRVMPLADDRSWAVKIEVDSAAGVLRLKTQSAEDGESETEVKAAIAGPAATFGINGRYALEFLAAAPEGEIRIGLKDEQSAIDFRAGNEKPGEEYRYVVMPLRV